MQRDPVILGENYILSGSDIGVTRPNDNQLIVGCSGTGKSTSTLFPTLMAAQHSNPVVSYAKSPEAFAMAKLLSTRGYRSEILDLSRPELSTVAYDPLLYIDSYQELDELCATIVHSTLKKTVDDYWNSKAKHLLGGLCAKTFMTEARSGMREVLCCFDSMRIFDTGSGISTSLDEIFDALAQNNPDSYAVREFNAFRELPYKTASCVRDTLAAALSTVFPEDIREMMRSRPQICIEEFALEKTALFVISGATDLAQTYYANLFFRDFIRQLLKYAAQQPSGVLPRPVRLLFDDFACTSPIEGFENDISLFRAAGISAMLLLQSETQLEAVYGAEKAAIIRQNCPVYSYFPGGFDDRSCALVAKRMNVPYDEILYAPLGKVFIMQTGRKPVHIPRYPTVETPEFREYLDLLTRRNDPCRNDRL